MDLWGGVEGGLMVRGCFGDEGVEWGGSGRGGDLRSWSSCFLKSRSFSNLSRPGLKDLTLGGVGCLGGVFSGYLGLEEDVFWAYDLAGGELLVLDFGCEGGGLLVPTWDDFREWGSAGWSFLPLFPTVSHSVPDSSVLTVGDEGGVGFFFYSRWCGRHYGSLLFLVCWNRWRGVPGFWSGFFEAFFPGQTAERWPISPQCQQAGLRPETIIGSLCPSTSNQLGTE